MWNLERFGYKFLFGVVSWPQKLFNFLNSCFSFENYYVSRMVKNCFVWTWFSCVRGEKVLQPKIRHSDISLKNGSNDFFGILPEVSTKYDLQFDLNLFLRKVYNFKTFGLKIVKKLTKLRFFSLFSQLCIISFPWFCT